MGSVLYVLNRTFTVAFYRSNAGFFLLIGLLCFGFMSRVEHVALARVLVSSVYTLAIAFAVWAVYSIKIIAFNRREMKRAENLVLFEFGLLPPRFRAACASLVFTLQFLPAVLYALFLIAVAGPSRPEMIALIVLAIAACSAVGSLIFLRSFRLPQRKHATVSSDRWLHRRLRAGAMRFRLEWLLRTDGWMVLGTKLFTCALLAGTGVVYRHEDFDMRLLAMALAVCGIASLLIVYRLHEFEHVHMAWWKNMPVARARRFGTIALVLLMLCVPEGATVFAFFDDQRYVYGIVGLVYLVSVACLLIGILQVAPVRLEEFSKRSFWILIALLLIVLLRVPPVILAAVNMAAGYLLFARHYYSFEPLREGTGLPQ